jgi:hypothetical protein
MSPYLSNPGVSFVLAEEDAGSDDELREAA